ncbi:restriction endonuclease subunit S [Salegentibacter sp. UBA1130]|uniref:restriction endonuclease subunit S n=1 Tax=Salegentibacter sp. UBA1130 TaxID=1947451 RepID=UPI00257BA7DB|nr:restriction endonuclease subunit S [Salegentibacter sp. UBA1130]
MPENWKKYRLGDLIEVNKNSIRKGALDWINYIDIKSVGTGFYEEPKRMNFEDAPSRARRLLKEGDTVISSVRPNLKSYFYSQNLKENSIASTGFAVLTPKNIDKRFLYYLTTNDNYINYLVQSCTGSAYPAFGPQVLLDSEVLIPESIQEQKSISSILSALDDKIELNLQMNKNLEEMAMALYKHWFVDFGPFQDGEFVASDLGDIPKGWKVRSIYSIANFINGAAFKPKDFIENRQEGLPVIKIAEIKQGITSQTKYSNKSLDKKYTISNGDILFPWSGNPHTSLGIHIWDKGDALLNQHIFVVRMEDINQKCFAFNLLKYQLPTFINLATHKQTTGLGHITVTNLKELYIPYPNIEAIEKYNKEALPIFNLLYHNQLENISLTQLRDTLLPKLISGEVRVKDAEKTLSEVL